MNHHSHHSRALPTPRSRAAGFSLIELMISLLLGLLVVGAAIGIFLSNRQTFTAAQNLGSIQENARTAFELMARDLREAGGNPCVNDVPVVNVVNGSAGNWYTNLRDWSTTVEGFGGGDATTGLAFGTGAAERVNGTDAIQILSAGSQVSTINAHDTAGNQFTVTGPHQFAAGDLVVACNGRQASMFQATNVAGQVITNGTGGVTPGNCTSGLALQPVGVCNAAAGAFQYEAPNSVLTKLNAIRWYVGNNARGGTSLYQSHLRGGATAAVQNDEIIDGVTNMAVTYLLRGAADYGAASTVGAANWGNVIAMRIDLTLVSEDNVGTDGNPLQRHLIQVASLRNRNP